MNERKADLLKSLHDAIDQYDVKQAHKLADELAIQKPEEKKPIPVQEKPEKKRWPRWIGVNSWTELFVVTTVIGSLVLLLVPAINRAIHKAKAPLVSVEVKAINPEEICTTDEQRDLIKKYPPKDYWLIFERRENRDAQYMVTERGYFVYPIGKSPSNAENPIRMDKNSENDLFIRNYQKSFCRAYTIHDWNTGQIPNYRYFKTLYYDYSVSDYGVIVVGDSDQGMRILCDRETTSTLRYYDAHRGDNKEIKNSNSASTNKELGTLQLQEIGGWVVPVPSYSGKLKVFIPRSFDPKMESDKNDIVSPKDSRFYVITDWLKPGFYDMSIAEPVLDRDTAKKLTGFAVRQKIFDEEFVIIYPMRADYEMEKASRDRRVVWPRYRLSKDLWDFAEKEFGDFHLPIKLPDKKEY